MTIYYMASPFHNRSILFDDINNIGRGLDEIINKYKLEYKDLDEKDIILDPECNALYKKYLNILQERDKEKLKRENPWTMLDRNYTLNNIAYMEIRYIIEKKYSKKLDGREVAEELRKYLIGEKKLLKKPYQLKAYLKTKEMLEYYEKLTTEPKKGEKYILFALQNQPEATTAPLAGGMFSNQLISIEMLANSLPKGVMLYVKEHPSQAYMAKTKKYYQKISQIKNVRLMPIESNQYDLMKDCIATATATGTMALESAIMGKPCISFGKFIYNYLDNTLPVRKNDDCKKAVEKVINGDVNISIKDVKIFFKALYEYSEPGNVGYWNYNKVKNAKEVSTSVINDIRRKRDAK